MRLLRRTALICAVLGAVALGQRWHLRRAAATETHPHSRTQSDATRQIARALAAGLSRRLPERPLANVPTRRLRIRAIDTERRALTDANVTLNGGRPVHVDDRGIADLEVPDTGSGYVVDTSTESGRVGRRRFNVSEYVENEVINVETLDSPTLRGRVVDPDGEPIAHAHLNVVELVCESGASCPGADQYAHVRQPETYDVVAADQTDADELLTSDGLGEFVIPMRARGSFAIAVSAAGYKSAWSRQVQLKEGADETIDNALTRSSRVRIRVVDQRRNPVGGARVVVSQSGIYQFQPTGEDGSVTFDELDENEFELQVTTGGYETAIDRHIGRNDSRDIEIQSDIRGSISLCARNADQNELNLVVIGRDQARTGMGRRYTNGDCETQVWSDLEAGDYQAVVQHADEVYAFPSVHVENTEVRLDLDATRRCEIRIESAEDEHSEIVSFVELSLPDESLLLRRIVTHQSPLVLHMSERLPLTARTKRFRSGELMGEHTIRCGDTFVVPPNSESGNASGRAEPPRLEQERRYADDEPVHEDARCVPETPSVAFMADGAQKVAASELYRFSQPLLSGDIYSDARGRPASPEEVGSLFEARPCDQPFAAYVYRPSTHAVIRVEFSSQPL